MESIQIRPMTAVHVEALAALEQACFSAPWSAAALAEELDKFGSIHKALQTSGYADPEVYRRVIDKFDYIMQDIKLVDEEEHIKYTGVSNKKILQNIEYLKISGKEFLFRVPMIPGITDTEENLEAIAKLTEGYPVEYLKYNDLAGAKYEMLGMKYRL